MANTDPRFIAAHGGIMSIADNNYTGSMYGPRDDYAERRLREIELAAEREKMEGTTELAKIVLRKTEDGYLVQVNVNGRWRAYAAEDVKGAMEKVVAAIATARLEDGQAVAQTQTAAPMQQNMAGLSAKLGQLVSK